ncbi:MAG: ribonucleoside-diphosphate reductase subunit alpha, partial [Kiloniellales bacterium]|nr:ribonucleoside-diphosphate reductase subunit alpha [Kiloniellales bacterium]
RGGGIGSYWGNLRSIGERVGQNGKTSGVLPFIRVMDSLTLAISQGSLRRGSAAVYLPVSHPEIEEFIELRRPTGGDPNRKALNLHNAVVIPDAFMRAVEADDEWPLISPKDGTVVRRVSARSIWIRILTARIETGEPYMLFIDHVNRAVPAHQKLAGLDVKMSNLCSEITLPTGPDHLGEERTAVCCLSSLNLDNFLAWRDEPRFIEDVMRFLDNVLSDFIEKAPDSMARARYAAMRERSVGLGVMGFHSFLQKNRVPIEGVMAQVWNRKIFGHIRAQADAASKRLAEERGACPDAAELGIQERFSNKMAIAPTASISIICGGASPGIEPAAANSYTHKTLSGSFNVRNRHLAALLEEKGCNDEETWSSITLNEGSVQHLDCLSQDEKDVFKTAFELDQRWLIDLAAERAPLVCQAQSLNVFLPADVHKRDLHRIHFRAWKKGVKSLYYCRSKSIQRAESAVGEAVSASARSVPLVGRINGSERPAAPSDDECLACQ